MLFAVDITIMRMGEMKINGELDAALELVEKQNVLSLSFEAKVSLFIS
jgi:hypothetical protein